MRRGLLTLLTLLLLLPVPVRAEQEKPQWPGVDKAVVEKYAKELGRAPRAPYINTDQGDLLLFLFTFAGCAGGFVMGYFWHKVFVAGKKDLEGED